MVSTVPARAPLGASTTNRKYYLDVYDPEAPGVPVGVFGIKELKPKPNEATMQDDSDMDSNGFKSSTATAMAWGAEGKVGRKTLANDQTAYDPGQEILRKAARKMGAGNRVKCRIYEMEPDGPRIEAYEGYAAVTWAPSGGGMDALADVDFTLVGQGELKEIAHPEDAVAVPVISSIPGDPAGDGEEIVIRGAYFDTEAVAATYVKVGGVNAPSYEVLDSETILATMPTGDAGVVPVVVGTGEPYLYTRGA